MVEGGADTDGEGDHGGSEAEGDLTSGRKMLVQALLRATRVREQRGKERG